MYAKDRNHPSCSDAGRASSAAQVSLPIERIFERVAGAYSANTIRGYGADLRLFAAWCLAKGLVWLPVSPETLAAYIDEKALDLAPTSVRRTVSAVSFAHRMEEFSNPAQSSAVRLALRRASRLRPRRPAQAIALTAALKGRLLADLSSGSLADIRDAAIIAVGYDTLCRSCELAAMTVEHVRFNSGGECRLIVPRSKGDQVGDGRIAWLSPDTAARLEQWIEVAKVRSGPLFRSLHLRRVGKNALDTSSIRRLITRAGHRVGVRRDGLIGLSGHSMRVGAAQDMLLAGFDAIAIMQAGGWRSPDVLLRYVENASTQTLHQRRWAALQALELEPSAKAGTEDAAT